MKLHEYVMNNAIRCAPDGPGATDVIFFGVRKAPGATAEALKAAMASHTGEFCVVDPLDGKEHNFLELGAWIGDQGAALDLIGLGAALGMWELLTPKTVMGDMFPHDLAMKLAGLGMVAMRAVPQGQEASHEELP